VSRGNAIIAEILRLSEFVPPAFRMDIKQQDKHADIIFDFSYFNNAAYYDHKIETNIVSLLVIRLAYYYILYSISNILL